MEELELSHVYSRRIALQITQTELAAKAGVSRSSIAKIENHRHENISTVTRQKVSNALKRLENSKEKKDSPYDEYVLIGSYYFDFKGIKVLYPHQQHLSILFKTLLTVREAAIFLGCSMRSVCRYIAAGRLACIQDGPKAPIRIHRQALYDFLECNPPREIRTKRRKNTKSQSKGIQK